MTLLKVVHRDDESQQRELGPGERQDQNSWRFNEGSGGQYPKNSAITFRGYCSEDIVSIFDDKDISATNFYYLLVAFDLCKNSVNFSGLLLQRSHKCNAAFLHVGYLEDKVAAENWYQEWKQYPIGETPQGEGPLTVGGNEPANFEITLV